MLVVSCNSESSSSVSYDVRVEKDSFGGNSLPFDSASVNIDSLGGEIIFRDSTGISDMLKNTTSSVQDVEVKIESSKKRSAVLGYSYFKNMRYDETRSINVYVSVINSISKVIDTLREINSEIPPSRKNDTASIITKSVITKNILLYKYLTVSLIDPDSNFNIKGIHDNDRQQIDSTADNSWAWSVTPKTKKSHVRLVLKVIAEKQDGSLEPFGARNIPIDISVDTGIFRAIYLWLYSNPDKALAIVLIPLIGFFWRQLAAIFRRPNNGSV